MDAYLSLARGDSSNAARTLGALRANVPSALLEWGLVEPLPVERLLLARLALARKDFAEADRIASVFSHPAPVAYLPFLPAARGVKRQATRGQPNLVARNQGSTRPFSHAR
jgi:hypothetical protein